MKKRLLFDTKEEAEEVEETKEIERAEKGGIWENDIEGSYRPNELAPVSIRTSVKRAKEREMDNFGKSWSTK